jgi:hypothetical protein
LEVCQRLRRVPLCCRTTCSAKPVVATACLPPFMAPRVLPDLSVRRLMLRCCSLSQEYVQCEAGCRDSVSSAIHGSTCAARPVCAPAADAALLLSVAGVRAVRSQLSRQRVFCHPWLRVCWWTHLCACCGLASRGSGAARGERSRAGRIRIHEGDRSCRVPGRRGCAQRTRRSDSDTLTSVAVFVLREAGCHVLDRQGCIQRARRQLKWPFLKTTSVRNATRRGASDTRTRLERLWCCARLVVSWWTGKVAFNVHAGDRSGHVPGRHGCARRDAAQCPGHAHKLGAAVVLCEAGCLMLDRQGCIQRTRWRSKWPCSRTSWLCATDTAQ